jgi:hypothetical protein
MPASVVLARVVLIFAAALLGAQAVVLSMHGARPPGPALSNGLQLGIGLLFIVAALDAARAETATRFERRFMQLMAARYVLWSGGQALATYYEIVGKLDFAGSPAHLLFTVEDVALGVALCLDTGHPDRSERPRAHELILIALFWTAVYLYIRFLGSESDPLYVTWDALVAASFYLRAMLSRSQVGRTMFGRWVPVLLLSSANHAFASHHDSVAGAPFDLIWSADMILWILTALTWAPIRMGEWGNTGPLGDPTVRHLPMVVACFSLVLALGIAQRRPLAAALLVVATAVCLLAGHLARRRQISTLPG